MQGTLCVHSSYGTQDSRCKCCPPIPFCIGWDGAISYPLVSHRFWCHVASSLNLTRGSMLRLTSFGWASVYSAQPSDAALPAKLTDSKLSKNDRQSERLRHYGTALGTPQGGTAWNGFDTRRSSRSARERDLIPLLSYTSDVAGIIQRFGSFSEFFWGTTRPTSASRSDPTEQRIRIAAPAPCRAARE